jgi:hypothetical protein
MSPRVTEYVGPWWDDGEATGVFWMMCIIIGMLAGRLLVEVA